MTKYQYLVRKNAGRRYLQQKVSEFEKHGLIISDESAPDIHDYERFTEARSRIVSPGLDKAVTVPLSGLTDHISQNMPFISAFLTKQRKLNVVLDHCTESVGGMVVLASDCIRAIKSLIEIDGDEIELFDEDWKFLALFDYEIDTNEVSIFVAQAEIRLEISEFHES